MTELLDELRDKVQSDGYAAKSDIHTLSVSSPQGTHHIKRCGDCGEAYSHKATTKECPTCGVKIFKGHHH